MEGDLIAEILFGLPPLHEERDAAKHAEHGYSHRSAPTGSTRVARRTGT